jgi:branched-chain amino acid aminotransferase
MSECIGNSFILNGDLVPTELFNNSMVYEGKSVYEVIRLVRGRPVFYTDHFERLMTSTKLQLKEMLAGSEELRRDIISLSKSEKKKETNLKIVFNYNKSDNYLLYLIESVYPTKEQYAKGVMGAFVFAERKEPESKIIRQKLRSEIYNKLLIEGAYEAVLVNKEGCITEGSRSNIFFIEGDQLYTAPDGSVLNGITRKHVLEICRENGISVKYTLINSGEISNYDNVFMTGTSPVVLPFQRIDKIYFRVDNPLIKQLRNMYLIRMEESIRLFNNH